MAKAWEGEIEIETEREKKRERERGLRTQNVLL